MLACNLLLRGSGMPYNNNNNNSQIVPAYAGCGEIPMYTILPRCTRSGMPYCVQILKGHSKNNDISTGIMRHLGFLVQDIKHRYITTRFKQSFIQTSTKSRSILHRWNSCSRLSKPQIT